MVPAAQPVIPCNAAAGAMGRSQPDDNHPAGAMNSEFPQLRQTATCGLGVIGGALIDRDPFK